MELIRVEEKQLIVAEEIIQKIKDLETKKKLIDEKEKEFKEKLIKVIEENELSNTSFESNDKTLKITYTPGGTTQQFSSKALQEEDIETWRKYLRPQTRKGSIRITVRESEDNE